MRRKGKTEVAGVGRKGKTEGGEEGGGKRAGIRIIDKGMWVTPV